MGRIADLWTALVRRAVKWGGWIIDGVRGPGVVRFRPRRLSFEMYEARRQLSGVPYATPDSYTFVEDSGINTIHADGLLTNDIPSSGLTAVLYYRASHGTAVIALDGSFTYAPDADFDGMDTFVYKAIDPLTDQYSPACVTVTVTPVNDPPQAVDDTALTNETTVAEIDVLANDRDDVDREDNSTFSLTSAAIVSTTGLTSSPAAAGTLSIVDRHLEFDPAGQFKALDECETATVIITYTMADAGGLTSTATVTLTVEGLLNHSPIASPISDIYIGAVPTGSTTVNLNEYFSDADDPDADLTYAVYVDAGGSLVSAPTLSNGNPTITAVAATGGGGTATIRVRATDPLGAYDETTFDVNVVGVTSIDVEVKLPNGTWEAVPANEALWDDLTYRWTAHVDPLPPSIDRIEWLQQSWPSTAPGGTAFADEECDCPSESNPGLGDWAVIPKIHFGGQFTMLANPERVVVGKITAVDWQAHSYADGLADFYPGGNTNGGGDKMYAEKREHLGAVHDTIDIQVQVNWTAPVGWTAKVYLKAFDPDHYSEDVEFDTWVAANDNMVPDAEGLLESSGDPNDIGGSLAATALTFNSGEVARTTTFQVASRQPGNNFIVAGAGLPEYLEQYYFAEVDGALFSPTLDSNVPDHLRTEILTIWRTLWVEEDSLGSPPASEIFAGAGVGNDDVNPMNLGTALAGQAGIGDFAQPSLALLTSEFSRVSVEVRTIPTGLDVRDDAAFVRNIEPQNLEVPGMPVRDVPTNVDFWVVQVFAAYDAPLNEDIDILLGDDPEIPTLGLTRTSGDAPVNVFLETIRDFCATESDEQPRTTITERTVLHEVLHRFAIRHGEADVDRGVLSGEANQYGDVIANQLLGSQMRRIIALRGPA